MRMAGLVEAAPTLGSGTPYAVTEWARLGVAPLAAAGQCEQVQMRPLAAPVTRDDVEAAFMLSVPLVGLPREATGRCHLTVEGDPAKGRGRSGVEVVVEGGHVVGCAADLGSEPGQYVSGSVETWFTALLDARLELLEYAGGKLPMQLVRGLHEALVEPTIGVASSNGSPPGAEGAQPAAASSAAASPTKGTSSS
jgi:hypothetical protein